MVKNILITGGAGYIGAHVTEILLKKNRNVFLIDNLSTGHRKLINSKAKFFKIDIKNKQKVKKIIEKYKIDSIIHLAANLIIGEGQRKPNKYYKNNVLGTKKLLDACKDTTIKNFIFSSTAAIYKEGQYKVSENSIIKPKSIYGQTKIKAEKIIKSFAKKNKINYGILRYFNIAGASLSGKIGLINKKSDHLFNISKILNCGYNKGTSVIEVAKEFKKQSSKKVEIIFANRRNNDLIKIIASNNKLKNFINWKPKFNNLRKIVKSCIIWEKKLN